MSGDSPSLAASNGKNLDANSLHLPSPNPPGNNNNVWRNRSAEELLSSRASEASLASTEKRKGREKSTHKEQRWLEVSREREEDTPRNREDMFTRDRSRPRDLSGIKKSVSTKVSDARAGLSRIRDAVGLRGSKSRPSPEISENFRPPDIPAPTQDVSEFPDSSYPSIPPVVRSAPEDVPPKHSTANPARNSFSTRRKDEPDKNQIEHAKMDQQLPPKPKPKQPDNHRPQHIIKHQLHRPSSSETLSKPSLIQADPNARYPRHFSFSLVEDSVLTWNPVWADHKDDSGVDNSVHTRQNSLVDPLFVELSHENLLWTQLQRQLAQIKELEKYTIPWVNEQTKAMETMSDEHQHDLDQLLAVYHEKTSDFTELEQVAKKLAIGDGHLVDEIKQIELLSAKLDYELKGLESRVEDVLIGLEDYEKRIQGVEARIHTIIGDEDDRNRQSWFHWLVSWLWGGPVSSPTSTSSHHSSQFSPVSTQ